MRWLLVSDEFPWPLHHGTYLRVFHLAAQLARSGEQVHLLCGGPAEGPAPAAWTQMPGLSLTLADAFDPRPGYKNLYPVNRRLEALIAAAAGPFDAALLFHPRSLALVDVVTRCHSRAYVIADLIDDFALEQLGRLRGDLWRPLRLARRLKHIREHRQFEASCAASVDCFTFVSPADADRFSHAHDIALADADRTSGVHAGVSSARCLHAHMAPGASEKPAVAVVPNGVEVERFRPDAAALESLRDQRAAAGGPTIVFPGRFVHPPNVQAAEHLARRVAPALRRVYPGAQVVLLGADPPERLRKLAGTSVVVTGYVDDMRPHLWRADLAALPMLSGAGQKNKLLEAWAAGLPVVATPLACRGAAAVDGANVLMARPGHDFVAAVLKLLGDVQLRRQLVNNGIRTVCEQYAWPAAAAALVSLASDRRCEA